jgi:predicted ribosome quality control (RQC) complex YloA/Tae2 family protein
MKVIPFDNVLDVYIGQNAIENWKLIDRFYNKNYMWFHLEDYPSCHVFVENDTLTTEDIKDISLICKEHTSKCKDKKNVKVCYTHISNLKKGKDTGSVLFKNINIKKIIKV